MISATVAAERNTRSVTWKPTNATARSFTLRNLLRMIHLPLPMASICEKPSATWPNMAHRRTENTLMKSNPSPGQSWTADNQARSEKLLRELGCQVDELRGKSPDAIESWIRNQGISSENLPAREAFFEKNPHLRQESIANLDAMERNSIELFEREDGEFLLLPFEETAPWVSLLAERTEGLAFAPYEPDDEASVAAGRKVMEEIFVPFVCEMAESIFTPDRIAKLIVDLRRFREE
jgi:hypothetical protein